MDIQHASFVHDTIFHNLWSGVFRESMVHLLIFFIKNPSHWSIRCILCYIAVSFTENS